MISVSKFVLENNQREILPMDQNEFPYICYFREMDSLLDKNFPWHWHDAMEINYAAEGEIEIKTPGRTLCLQKGDAAFINSNVMHDIRSRNSMSGCRIYTHLFDMHLLSGMFNSIYERKYLAPVMKSSELQAYLIHADSYRHVQMLEKIIHLLKLADEEPFGYEFEIRSELCRFWCLFFEDTAALRAGSPERGNMDEERLKQMMDYIHTNYAEKITLGDIATAASISSRECTRCFQRCIGISPVNYLINYRVRTAARMLLTTGRSITSISEDCGFSSPSYFGKTFYDYMHCTPRKYRQQTDSSDT